MSSHFRLQQAIQEFYSQLVIIDFSTKSGNVNHTTNIFVVDTRDVKNTFSDSPDIVSRNNRNAIPLTTHYIKSRFEVTLCCTHFRTPCRPTNGANYLRSQRWAVRTIFLRHSIFSFSSGRKGSV